MSSLSLLSKGHELTIFVDIADPYSHLAVPGTLALLEQTQHSARWLPFTRPVVHKPPSQRDDEDRGERHKRLRKEYQDRELRFYAQALDLPLSALYQGLDTLPFAHALLWLAHSEPEADHTQSFVQLSFHRHWSSQQDLSDCTVISQLLSECGASGVQWQQQAAENAKLTAEARVQCDTHLAAAQQAGLFNTPAYLHNEEVFYGRAHLPLLRQRLTSA